ncbi:MAG: hypothetical protein HEQ34_11410 [Sphingorhabdus sp.]|uniref:hypothetical protein n=1 Tax=Sphingorhabdus sp. TaxID=1902408 RepID=UPI0025FE1D02|nr:hypothetical protein [Sphingorhabdus sp.]MCO4092547.1 hypothetical protein [Sphingorhabdus sp.]
MSDDSFWSRMFVMGVLAGSLYYCTREDEPAPPEAAALAMPSSMTVFDDMPGNKLGVMAIPAALEGAGGQGVRRLFN